MLSMCEVTWLLARHCPVARPGCRSLREPAPTHTRVPRPRATSRRSVTSVARPRRVPRPRATSRRP
eukprot:1285894-Prymnesium_polylepis.1